MVVDWQAIGTFVSTLGFPIAMCILMWRYNTKTMEDVKQALNNNTQALQQVILLVKRDWLNGGDSNNG